eukprot:332570-Amphidinium_carterae.1
MANNGDSKSLNTFGKLRVDEVVVSGRWLFVRVHGSRHHLLLACFMASTVPSASLIRFVSAVDILNSPASCQGPSRTRTPTTEPLTWGLPSWSYESYRHGVDSRDDHTTLKP